MLLIITIISIAISMISIYYTFKTKKRYEVLALKLGNGIDISEIMKKYIQDVNNLDLKDDQIIDYCNKLSLKSKKYICKIGTIQYNAYEDNKNKLSFSVALLTQENSGIILNSVYTKDEGSNIFLKEIIKGTSKINLSDEEKIALNRAMNIEWNYYTK